MLIPGHWGVVQHMQVKKLGIGLNFIEIRVGLMFVFRLEIMNGILLVLEGIIRGKKIPEKLVLD